MLRAVVCIQSALGICRQPEVPIQTWRREVMTTCIIEALLQGHLRCFLIQRRRPCIEKWPCFHDLYGVCADLFEDAQPEKGRDLLVSSSSCTAKYTADMSTDILSSESVALLTRGTRRGVHAKSNYESQRHLRLRRSHPPLPLPPPDATRFEPLQSCYIRLSFPNRTQPILRPTGSGFQMGSRSTSEATFLPQGPEAWR